MNTQATPAAALAAFLILSSGAASAHDDTGPRPDSHAPISVMGDHRHKKGEWMVSYRFMRMDMAGSRIGTDSIDPETTATTIPNRFFGIPGQPPTLRVVPTEMTMQMHMLGVMYAPSDRVTLMAMLPYIETEMKHVTFQGPAGTTRLGEFTTRASGIGDVSISSLIGLFESDTQSLHATVGVALPTGSNTGTDQVFTPMGMRPTMRVAYAMHPGSGSWSGILGLTHLWQRGVISGGSQWRSLVRLNENNEGYTFGDEHRLTGWGAWRFANRFSASARLEGYRRGNVDGIDPMIVAPSQGADPDRQKIERIDVGLGLNWAAAGRLEGHRLAVEWVRPLYQKLSGPQLKTDWTVTVGWQYAF